MNNALASYFVPTAAILSSGRTPASLQNKNNDTVDYPNTIFLLRSVQ